MITIGRILKPQGIKGELKVLPITDDVTRYRTLKEVLIDDTSFRVTDVRVRDGFAYLRLAGIDDRTTAERFAGLEIGVRREDAVQLPPGRYFVDEVVGSVVYVGSETIGTVTAIDNFGSADVYTVTGERTVRFPLLNDLIEKIDPERKEIRLRARRFEEVAVYEN